MNTLNKSEVLKIKQEMEIKAINLYNKLILNPAFVPLSLKNWLKLASEEGLFGGNIGALTSYYKNNHLDTDLESIMDALVNNQDFCREQDIEDEEISERKNYLTSTHNEEDIREFFNELVQQGAKKISKGKHSFTKNI